MTFTVPGNPIPWQRSQSNGRRHFTASATRAYQAKVKLCARAARLPRLFGPVTLTVVAYRKNAHRCDWDNLGKTISDALNGIAYEDDSQIDDARVLKRIDRINPRAEVFIRPSTEES